MTDEGRILMTIAERAETLAHRFNRFDLDKLEFFGAVSGTHKIVPLNLDALLASDDANFSHDVFGIVRHFNPITDKLENCFLPRFSRKGV